MVKLFVLFFLLILQANSVLAAVSIEAAVDKTEASMEDIIELSVTISGLQSSPEPELPNLSGFTVSSGGTSSSIQIINGNMTARLIHIYRLYPKRTGKFTIGPIILRHNNKVYRSRPFTIRIVDTPTAGRQEKESLFIEATVSNERPYVNEQITYIFRFYRSVDVSNPRLELPEFDRFWKEEVDDQKKYRKVINGKTYLVTELKAILFPTTTGRLTIAPASLQVDVIYRTGRQRSRGFPFNDFFNRGASTKRKILRSQPLILNVLSLPEMNKPDGFYNIIGELKLTAGLSKKEIEQGETTTLTLTVSGYGNVKDVKLPDMDFKGNKYKIYDDKPEYTQEIHNGSRLFGVKTMKRALVPLQDGSLHIPAIKIPYFNTKTKKYDTLRTPPVSLTVNPSQEKERLHVTKLGEMQVLSGRKVRILATDLLDIHTDLSDLKDRRFSPVGLWLYSGFFISPIFCFCFFVYIRKTSRRFKEDVAYGRRRTAYKKTMKRLKTFEKLLQSDDTKKFYNNLSKILREYIGDKLNLQGAAFTSVDVEQRLEEKEFEAETINSIRKILEKCEMAQYGAAVTHDDNRQETVKEVKQLLNWMEKRL